MLLKRNDTHVNEYNPFLTVALKCNHDIKYLANSSSQSMAVLYYLTNYLTKNGLSTYNAVGLVLLAYENREKYLKDNSDVNYRCMNLLYKAYNAAANITEYSGAQIGSMLLNNGRDGTYYSSHPTTCLYLTLFLKALDNENKSIINKAFENEDEDEYITLTTYNLSNPNESDTLSITTKDYAYRPKELEGFCLYRYAENYRKVKRKNRTIGNLHKYKFLHEHPMHEEYFIVERHENEIPVIIGPSVPRMNDLTNRDLYAKIILLLFRPWRKLNNLRPNNTSWATAFDSFYLNASEEIRQLISNLEYLSKATSDAEEERRVYSETNDFQTKDLADQSKYDEDNNDDFNELNEDIVKHMMDEGLEKLLGNTHNDNSIIDSQLDKLNVIGNDNEIDNSIKTVDKFLESYSTVHDKLMTTWQTQFKQQINISQENEIDNTIYIDDFNPLYIEKSPDNSIIKAPCSQQTVIDTYRLNKKQTMAFKLFTDPLFQQTNQRLIYLTGEGGTGKSQVIKAIKHYFNQNGSDYRIISAAPTGCAAHLIGGTTIHQCLSLGHKIRHNKSKANLQRMVAKWESVSFLIFDEVSMIGLRMINTINKQLMLAKSTDKLFGGINVLFCGDFFQLPPVNAKALYERTLNEKNEKINFVTDTYNTEVDAGRLLWLSLTHCIILDQQMRQKDDIILAGILSRMRTTNVTEEDYYIICTRILTRLDIQLDDARWFTAPIIVSRNKLRAHINTTKIMQYSTKTNKKIYVSKSLNTYLNRNGKRELIQEALEPYLNIVDESKTGDLANNLYLMEGNEYYLTTNISIELGLVNGARVQLIKICYEDSIQRKDNLYYFNKMPKYVLIKLINDTNVNQNIFNGLDSHVYPLFPIQKTFQFKPQCLSINMSVQRTQFPLTLCFGITAFKVQGKTLDKVVIDLAKPDRGALVKSYAYVCLSRAKRLSDLIILRDFDISVLMQPLSEDLLIEMDRLKKLELQTINDIKINDLNYY